MGELSQVLKLEKSVAEMVQGVKQKLIAEIENTALSNVHQVSSYIVIVRLSKLQRNIWTPEYYLPTMQAKYVAHSLEGVTTAHAFIKKVSEMIEKRNVKIGCNVHPLNDTTILILQKYR